MSHTFFFKKNPIAQISLRQKLPLAAVIFAYSSDWEPLLMEALL
jgi:hypothetical protein